MTRSFSRYRCWEQNRIGKVINVEATAVDRATFLATHTPMQTIRYEKSPRQQEKVGERDLLEDLQAAAAEDRHTFVVIKGIPGTGKSHLIRWLKDRYAEERIRETEQDVVLLIERSNSSLRGTLRQIVDSGVFGTEATRQHLARLERASGTLSKEALSDDLVNAFQVAAVESESRGEIEVRNVVAKLAPDFLLDPTVREQLQRPGGPVDRIMHFITEGRSEYLQPGEMPEFEEADFDFPTDVRRRMERETNRKVIPLLKSLWSKPEIRQDLAKYLNSLRSFAVGHTLQLSVEDVRRIFNDLRRDLRRRGKSLALFIEDITAFSGIDRGLIDVLATQHTGEGNREYCRILSVVGITDSYFQDQFPRNLQERVTHQLSLNTHGSSSNAQSDLLQEEQTLAALAARYLNAIRLSPESLEQWVQSGGYPEDLPIACETCPFRAPCHDAFGVVDVGASVPIGLYPFNLKALTTMYRGLKNETKTPRSLLREVLQYILNNHGDAISEGEFPPAPNQLANRYVLPHLEVGHDIVISSQAPNDHRRVASLVLYWGNASVYSTGTESERRVGELQEGVFRAFDIPFIAGQPPQTSAAQTQPSLPSQDGGSVSAKTGHVHSTKINNFAQEIQLWRDGERLNSYQEPRDLSINALLTGIDWDVHAVTLNTARSRLNGNSVRIEGQAGHVAGDYIELKRYPIFADALMAMTDIAELSTELPDDVFSGHLFSIRTWIDDVADDVIQFVRRPRREAPEPLPLLELYIIDAILLEWLVGNLSPQHSDPAEMFLRLVASASAASKSADFKERWEASYSRVREVRSQAWSGLMHRISAERAAAVYSGLLQNLNVPQGTSGDVLFVDAPTALGIIERFLNAGWWLRPLNEIKGAVPQQWDHCLFVYRAFEATVRDVLNEESGRYTEELRILEDLIGDESHSRVFESINTVFSTYREHLISHRFPPLPQDFGAADLRSTMSRLKDAVNSRSDTQRALIISSTASAYERAHAYRQYLESFLRFAREQEQEFESSIRSTEKSTSTGQTLLEVERLYKEMERQFQKFCDTSTEQEAAG